MRFCCWLLVGAANYCSAMPLRCAVGNARPTKRGAVGILLDTIGIASICALLVVSTAPEVMHDIRRFVPTLVGFAVLGASFYKHAALSSQHCLALAYGLATESDGDYITHKNHFSKTIHLLLFVTVVTISAEINEVIPKWIVRLRPLNKC